MIFRNSKKKGKILYSVSKLEEESAKNTVIRAKIVSLATDLTLDFSLTHFKLGD